jgi:uncharacterized protein
MNGVFADTFYFLAVVNRHDASHARALDITRGPQRRLFTTSWVLIEVADALSSPGHRDVAMKLIRELQRDPNVTIVGPTQAVFDRGLELFERRRDKSWTLTDCISFCVMQEVGLSEALTGDRHFEQAGFLALLVHG